MTTNQKSISITNKMDNDDLDVTKGCEIIITITDNLEELIVNPIEHRPYIIGGLKLYAGVGVGIVTKDGLKPPRDYPAINPTPLDIIKEIYYRYGKNRDLYATISVTNGEIIAQNTANSKVGIVGGISILGTTGFVKPISSTAYIDSIKVEIQFIKSNGYKEIVLTLGNSSLEYAKRYYKKEQIVEIGNFIYDALDICDKLEIDRVIFICGIGKAVKVAQGYKNTHNRFGSIDFLRLKDDIRYELDIEVDIINTKTVKGIVNQLDDKEAFFSFIEKRARLEIAKWFPNIDIEIRILR